jgi:HSP20 family protein
MSHISIQKVATTAERPLPIFREVEELIRQIQERAFSLAAGRGRRRGSALEDWLAAEREFCWPAAELVERDNDFVFSISLPGFEPGGIEVAATPRELIVKAKAESTSESKDEERIVWSDFRSRDVLRRVELEQDIDVEKVTATLKDGLLKIVAPKKIEEPAKTVRVSAEA